MDLTWITLWQVRTIFTIDPKAVKKLISCGRLLEAACGAVHLIAITDCFSFFQSISRRNMKL